jgi:hypothetical protein
MRRRIYHWTLFQGSFVKRNTNGKNAGMRNMKNTRRCIEDSFPVKEVSIISTLHIFTPSGEAAP